MGRKETEGIVILPVNDVQGTPHYFIVERAQTTHCRLDDVIGHTVGQYHADAHTGHHEHDLLHRLVVLDYDIKQDKIQRYPGQPVGECHRQIVQKQRTASIEQLQQAMVYLRECLHALLMFH